MDTSAVMAILLQEPDAQRFAEAVANAPARRMSVANLVELTMVAAGRGHGLGDRELDAFLARSLIEPVPVDPYALARELGEPLLFKGGDFALTDVAPALA